MQYSVSSAPHIHAKANTAVLMLDVVTALMPCAIAGIWLFGWAAARVLLISIISCVLFELLYQLLAKKPVRINDLSAVVTGLILGLNLPSTAPWWMIVVGSLVAIVLVKQLFGGIGDNFVNPALAARAVLLASWPALMSGAAFVSLFDGVSGATPLVASEGTFSTLDLLVGRVPGSIGEVCKIAILLGLVYLLIRKTITWHIPVTMIVSFAVFSWIFKGNIAAVPTELFSGSILFGAVFMATDYVTSPMTLGGKFIYAAGTGLIIALIRSFGSYPEGTTYAILLMNVVTPLLDRVMKHKMYGEVKGNV
ncbi:MAG: RnfABCDGE type electron transport complex subunit D [Clostridia bacterium]